MNAIRFWAPLLVLTTAAPVQAVLVDFNDLTPGTTYTAGNTFTSGGFQFNVIPYNGAGTSVSVVEGTAGRHLVMNDSIGIGLIFASSFGLLEFEFTNLCTSCSTDGITVNGISSPPNAQISNLDGTTFGGADIDVVLSRVGLHRMRITGPITSFAVGGTNMRFDNLRISVPEPATGLFATCSIAGIFLRRRW